MRKGYCIVCGLGRKTGKLAGKGQLFRLSESWVKWFIPSVKNKSYWFVHKECNKALLQGGCI